MLLISALSPPKLCLHAPPAVEQWLGNLGTLIGDNGLPRRVNPTIQTGRILAGVVTGDTSLDRYIVARGLVMHGYPDEEAAALLWHYCEYDKSRAKGSAWLKTDIARVLGKVRAEMPTIEPSLTRYRASAPAQTTSTHQAAKAWAADHAHARQAPGLLPSRSRRGRRRSARCLPWPANDTQAHRAVSFG